MPIMLDGAPRRRWRSFLRCVPLGTRPAHQPRNCFDPLRRDHTVQSERMELAPGLIIADRRDATGPGGRPREMRRQDGRGIAHSLVNLGLGQVACLKQACAREISARELVPAKSARSRSASLRSAPARLTRSSRASLKSASHRSAALRSAPVSVAKHNEACLSRVEERLMGPPLIGPICRWPTLKVRPLRFGTTSGFSEPCLPGPWAAAQKFRYGWSLETRLPRNEGTQNESRRDDGSTVMQTLRYRQAFGDRCRVTLCTAILSCNN